MQPKEPSSEDGEISREPSDGILELARDEAMFTLFQFLPKELRLCIWDHALIPRLISLYRREDSTNSMELAYLDQTSSEPVVIWIALACAESFRFVQKHYHEWELWDFHRDISNSLYSPGHDVVYFPYEFHAPTLLDLPLKYPDQTTSLRTLALPSTCQTVGVKLENDAMQVLEALHGFGGLKELVIVNTGKDTDKQWMEGQKVWKLPEDIEKGLKKLKVEKWPEWKIPMVRVVGSEESILQC